MNNNNLGTIFVGALVGAAVGYLVADWYIDTYIPEEGLELDAQPLDPADFGDKFVVKERKPKKTTAPSAPKNYTEYFKSQNRPELAALAAKYSGEVVDVPAREEEEVEGLRELMDDEQDDPELLQALAEDGLLTDSIDEEDDEEVTEQMDNDGNDPGIISMELYANDDEMTHTTLHYYQDGVLTDTNGIPINRPEKFLPDYALTSFGFMSNDPGIVYIRNTEKNAMYEIVDMEDTFAKKPEGNFRKKKEMGNVTGEDN